MINKNQSSEKKIDVVYTGNSYKWNLKKISVIKAKEKNRSLIIDYKNQRPIIIDPENFHKNGRLR